MKHFTVDAENNITVHATRKAARETDAGVFATEEQFADLIGPDNKRLLEIWNSLPGVKPVTKFTSRKTATEHIWKALQSLGESTPAATPEPVAPQTPDVAPEEVPAKTKATRAKKAPVAAQAGHHAIHCGIVLAWISRVGNQAINRPVFDAELLCRSLTFSRHLFPACSRKQDRH